MQNLIVFCNRCITWVEPFSDFCPECGAEVHLDEADPDLEDLDRKLGRQLAILGPLRIERQGLPNYGHFVGTTRGLLFLPRLHRRVNGAWEGVTSQRLPGWWPFRGDLGSPRFLDWLRRPFSPQQQPSGRLESELQENLQSLAKRMMDSPGAFFVEYRSLQGLTVRRRTLRIERPPQRTVTVLDETDDGSLGASLRSLAAQAASDQWKQALS